MTYGPKETYEPITVDVEVVNDHGLHARPAHQVVVLANHFTSAIRVIKDDLEVDAKSIMSLMMLAAEKGTVLTLRAEGTDSKEAIEALSDLFRRGFGE
ncbi:MAG: HPr family phosphocarrier protein [Planctomycetes bacterium]|nr:HPr family phosphocarrier protein [Planctomycetota bacterium]MCB9890730.1 HPr family phosphocarrier protein [Planctomycetota bacterium]MCB9920047.1 HPr family phosphocarrier protein [Planctomycetota bacterium]